MITEFMAFGMSDLLDGETWAIILIVFGIAIIIWGSIWLFSTLAAIYFKRAVENAASKQKDKWTLSWWCRTIFYTVFSLILISSAIFMMYLMSMW